MSGPEVKYLIERYTRGEKLTPSDIRKYFYSKVNLNAGGREITAKPIDNYVILQADRHLEVHGSGEAGVLKPMTSLTANDAEDFEVKSGKAVLRFEGQNLLTNTRQNEIRNAFAIDVIKVIDSDGRSLHDWELVGEKGEGDATIFRDKVSDRLVAGRIVLSGPYGVSSDVYIDMSKETYERVKKRVKSSEGLGSGTPGETLVSEMKEGDFRLRTDLYVPELEGITIKGVSDSAVPSIEENAGRTISEIIDKYELQGDFTKELPPEMLSKKVRQETIDSIASLVGKSLKGMEPIEPGRISISFKNNVKEYEDPDEEGYIRIQQNPSIIVEASGKSSEISLSGNDAELIKLVLEGSLRVPNLAKGKYNIPEDFQKK